MASSGEARVPGDQTKTATSILETATGTVQSLSPVKKIHQHLCAFHFYSYDLTRQIEAHHFCSHQNEEMRQCLIYDGPGNDARLIGIEYIVTEPIFETLPEGEKRLWHSHEYEVKSGVLYMPGVPGPIQRKDMEKLAKTYGKTIHFWQVDKGDPLPLGPPQLMMALTADGQLRDDLARDVEKKLGVSYAKERENRAYIEGPVHGIHPKANAGVIGKGIQLEVKEVEVVPLPSATTRIFV